MWLRCCCCCCGAHREEKPTALDDSSSLISQEGHTVDHAFYVPRRHSSFQPSTHHPVVRQPGQTHSDCSSSSDEEVVPEPRGRYWSTIPASDVDQFRAQAVRNRTVPPISDVPPGGRIQFDRHALSEIAEAERGEEPKTTAKVDAEVYGYITFSTTYEAQEQRLNVFLDRAEGLPRKGEEPYATYVRMSLSSSSKSFRLSRAVKRTLNPVYSEQHIFHTNRGKCKSAYLVLSVFDSDRQGRHDALGHALLPLDELGPEKREHRLPLTPMSVLVQNLGQVLVGVQYAPTQSRLAVHVIKARHLRVDPAVHKRHLRPIGSSRDSLDTFCKVTLTCGGQKVKTCRSRTSNGSDPFYDFRASFVVPPQYLRDTGAIVSVVAASALGRQGVTLGRATALGPYVEMGDGSSTQWGRMLQEGRSIVQWRNIYL